LRGLFPKGESNLSTKGRRDGTLKLRTVQRNGGHVTQIKRGNRDKIIGRYTEEIAILRYYRDKVLNNSPEGEIIKLYDQWSPVLVRTMGADEEFKEDAKEMIDGVLEMIE